MNVVLRQLTSRSGTVVGNSHVLPIVSSALHLHEHSVGFFKKQYSTRTVPKNHYDALGITPKATQAQIKSAYYRMSKQYHPDINKENDAQQRFSEISEAYDVLGNTKTRSLYDRGLLTGTYQSGTSGPNVDVEYHEFIKKRGQFGRRSAPTGRTNIYNFDEFYKEHYGKRMREQRISREEEEAMKEREEEAQFNNIRNALLYSLIISLIVGILSGRKKP